MQEPRLLQNKVDEYLHIHAAGVFKFSHCYNADDGASFVHVYTSVPPVCKSEEREFDMVTLFVNVADKTAWLTPPMAPVAFQRIASDVYWLLHDTTSSRLMTWTQHNMLTYLTNKNAENERLIERLEKRLVTLERTTREMNDEHNAWVVRQQLEAGIDPVATRTSDRAASYLEQLEDAAVDDHEWSLDMGEEDDQERPTKRFRSLPDTPDVEDKKKSDAS